MGVTTNRLRQLEVPEYAVTLRNAGVSGAGGAGFPTYAKWERLESVDSLLVNHQESEPNYYIDKWLGREHADELAALFDALLERAVDRLVVGAKLKGRQEWMADLERATDGAVYEPDELPIDPDDEGVVFAYTDDQYEYGMESVLLRMVTDVTLGGDDLPMDHGWIVQNTETLYNVYHALRDGTATTEKFVHVDGRVPDHRFLRVPVGTPAGDLLAAAGREDGLADDEVLLDGGPGWCFEVDADPSEFGVRKRTNCVLVERRDVVEENLLGEERISILRAVDWDEDHETEPAATVSPDRVTVPLITNPSFEGVVEAGEPIVRPDDAVEAGEMIARPAEGISIPQHAPIDGTVTGVTDRHVTIDADDARTGRRRVYWTWCRECGAYVPAPELERADPTRFVCEQCR